MDETGQGLERSLENSCQRYCAPRLDHLARRITVHLEHYSPIKTIYKHKLNHFGKINMLYGFTFFMGRVYLEHLASATIKALRI